MAVTRTSLMTGVVGYGVGPTGQTIGEGNPNEGDQIMMLQFIDQETGEQFIVWLSESACMDFGAKLQGKGIKVATPAEVIQINGAR